MKNALFLIVAGCSLAGLLHGQTTSDLNEGVRLTQAPADGALTFSWWGRAGRTYFIQKSEDLIHWTYAPIIRSGPDDVVEW